MDNSIIPESWQTLTKDGEVFFNNLANKYIEKAKDNNNITLVKEYSIEAVKFINSDDGQEADASVKEVTIEIIDFLGTGLIGLSGHNTIM